jgi:hypothetical protein
LYAQQYDKAIVKISQNPIDITTLAKTIAKQTGLEYSLNMQNASLKKRIALRAGNWKLSDILKQVQQQAGLNYRIIGDHILFMDYQPPVIKTAAPRVNTPVKATPSVKAVSNLKINRSNAPLAVKPPIPAVSQDTAAAITQNKDTATNKDAKPDTARTAGTMAKPTLISSGNKPDTVSVLAKRNIRRSSAREKTRTGSLIADYKDRFTLLLPIYNATTNYIIPKIPPPALFEGTDSAGNKKLPPKVSVPSLMKDIAAAKAKQKENNNRQRRDRSLLSFVGTGDDVNWYKPFVNAGISADEVLYLNASLMAGIKFIYGIISYGSAFPGSRLRWGAGIPFNLNDKQKLHLTFTTGSLKRRTDPDTLISYGVKESLTRYGAGWSKTVSPHITFQAQLQYNILKKTSDSTRAMVQNLTGDYGHFEYGSPSYILRGSYGEKGDFRRWLGLQISLFYKLF